MKKLSRTLCVLILIITSCTKKDVKLPVSAIPGIQDTIYNNTLVWMFFSVKDRDTLIKVNRNNTISTTNWIFNIDRRLPLKLVIPEIKKLQEKRAKPSMHQSQTPIHNYYSYVDTLSNKLSIIQFDSIKYVDATSIDFRDSTINYLVVTHKGFTLNNTSIKKEALKSLLKVDSITARQNLAVHFHGNALYQDYIETKALLELLKKDSIRVLETEIILQE